MPVRMSIIAVSASWQPLEMSFSMAVVSTGANRYVPDGAVTV